MPFKMTYRTPNNRLTFEAVVKDRFAAWSTLAVIQELFEEEQCGCCTSKRIRWMTRTSAGRDGQADNIFYEIVCDECGAKLEFGVTRDGTRIWPKRRDKNKNVMANRGWYIYEAPPKNDQDQQSQAPTEGDYNDQGGGGHGEEEIPF